MASSYVVKPGDTLSAIAQRSGVPLSSLSGYNTANPNLIYPGQKITIGGSSPAQAPSIPQAKPMTASVPRPVNGQPVQRVTTPKPDQNLPPQMNPSTFQPNTPEKLPGQVKPANPTQANSGNPTSVQATTQAIKSGANPALLDNARKFLGDQAYIGLCEAFVEKATQGRQGIYASAIDAWTKQAQNAKRDMSQIKPGDSVYFKPDASNGYYGHTGVYIGNNQFIGATYNGIKQFDIKDWMKQTGQQLLGFVPGQGNFMGQNIGSFASNVGNEVTSDVGNAVNNAGSFISKAVGNIGNAINPQAHAEGPSVPPTRAMPAPAQNNADAYGPSSLVQGTPDWLQETIVKASNKYGIPPAVLSALAEHESGGTWNPRLKQWGGGMGRGIFQIDLGQHPISEQQAFDPKFSADFAAKLLKEGYEATGNWTDALRYYNGGPNFDSSNPGYNGQSLHNITMGYANKVNSNLDKLSPYIDKKGKGKELPEQAKRAGEELNKKFPKNSDLPAQFAKAFVR